MDLTTLFCDVDDFYKNNSTNQQILLSTDNKKRRNRKKSLSPSEIMTILVYFHTSNYRNFKAFYIGYVSIHLKDMFPGLLSYNRFVEITPSVLLFLCTYLKSRLETPTGISYIDSTKIAVCSNKRISRNKVFSDIASIGKTTMGWFFGFKLHLIVTEQGGLIAVKVTPGNEDDRSPVPEMCQNIFGKLFGDKGYISKGLADSLLKDGIQLITSVRSNMKNKFLPIIDKILLRKRSVIETINDQLKNISQIEHTRHRSVWNFMVNLVCGLLAYTFQDKKPCIRGIEPIYETVCPSQLLLA
jgi:transposase